MIPLALLVRNADWRRRVKLAVVACLVGGLVLGPWIVFNLTRFEETTTLSSGTFAVVSAGSCDEVWYGRLIGYYANCFQGPWPPPNADESQRDIEPRKQAIQYTEDHLKRLPLVVAARVGRLWGFFKPGQTTALDWWIEGRGRAPSWIALFVYYAMLPFALVRPRRHAPASDPDPPAHRHRGRRHVRRGDHVRRHALPRPRRSGTRARRVDRCGGGLGTVARPPRRRAAPRDAPLTTTVEPPEQHTAKRTRRSFGFGLGLACIALAALVVRVSWVLFARRDFALRGDDFFYHWQANALAEGKGFINPFTWKALGQLEPSAAHPPLYSLYLAVYSWLGFDTPLAHRLHRACSAWPRWSSSVWWHVASPVRGRV